MNIDRKNLLCALGYVVLGMSPGVYLAASHNHGELVTHAHILLVGLVLSLAYGIIHRLWLGAPSHVLAMIQFILHHVGALTMFVGLFLLHGNLAPVQKLEPILAASSITVLVAARLMFWLALRTRPRQGASSVW